MFGTYEQEHARYRIESIYDTARQVRNARLGIRPRPQRPERRRFWDRVVHGFRQTAPAA
jgi:hypothetical protein